MKAVAVFPGKPDSIHLADLPEPSVDDVPDGRGVLVEVLRVGVDGTDKEIDLSDQHAKALRDALQLYVSAARKAGGSRGGRGPARDAEQIKAIRAWAKKQGMDVSERGRIRARIEEAYHAAH